MNPPVDLEVQSISGYIDGPSTARFSHHLGVHESSHRRHRSADPPSRATPSPLPMENNTNHRPQTQLQQQSSQFQSYRQYLGPHASYNQSGSQDESLFG
jgi:hypothetical protein